MAAQQVQATGNVVKRKSRVNWWQSRGREEPWAVTLADKSRQVAEKVDFASTWLAFGHGMARVCKVN